ncbi:MAG TPA: hypothetical protein VGQ55_01745 [Pyrinomonadaceae bacterium]|jgi:hypothetical protein|nr:hypothetical protein [Pyrinomonadaceae bacterium]
MDKVASRFKSKWPYTWLIVALFCVAAISAPAQTGKNSAIAIGDGIRSSPAYAELLLRKTELSAELESLILEYTEEYPKVRESRYAIALLDRDLTRIATIKPTDSGKLTLALGKLMLRRVELETELGMLLRTFKDEHPDVKRLKKKIEIYEGAIKEILG